MPQDSAALLAAYLIIGTDELKVRRVIERLDGRLEAAGGDPSFDRSELDAKSSLDPVLVRSTLDTLPFGADFRLVIVRNIDKAGKAVTDEIIAYLADPSPTTVLAMTAAKLARSSRLFKAVTKIDPSAVIDCAPKKHWELPRQVISMAKSHGMSMDLEAAELLVDLVGESTVLLDTELTKLAVALGDSKTIAADDVRRLVVRVAEIKPWNVLDAVCERDPALALELFDRMSGQNPMGFFTLAVGRIRELIAAKSLEEQGRIGSLAQELGLQQWQVKHHAAWARNYTMYVLCQALRSAADAEADLKSLPDKDAVLQKWLLSFCRPR